MTPQARGYERGRQAGANAARSLPAMMRDGFAQWRVLYPTLEGDLGAALIACDRQRLASEPELAKFPELRGHADLLRAERRGFREASGLGELEEAFQYSQWYFQTRVLEGRHLGRWDLYTAMSGCTNVFIPDGLDGVNVSDNRDIGLLDDMSKLAAWTPEKVFHRNAGGEVYWGQGGVSSAVCLDDEPRCSFPASPFDYPHLLPAEFTDSVDVMIEFLTRYNEFWGPGNKILVDKGLNAVMVEKTNCLVAFRKAGPTGAAAVTACAYLDEKLHAHQMEKSRRAAKLKGETEENSLEINYHRGSRKRYRRLVALTEAAAARGKPTIWDALDIVADHAVPYPDRVCLAGESRGSEKRNPKENWSVTQHATVITGPKRRSLYRSVQSRRDPRPVYDETPKLMLGPGVAMRPEWRAEIDAGKCVLGAACEAKAPEPAAAG